MRDKEEIICPCYDVTVGDVIQIIKENNVTTVEEIGDLSGAGTLCGACLEDLEELLKDVISGKVS